MMCIEEEVMQCSLSFIIITHKALTRITDFLNKEICRDSGFKCNHITSPTVVGTMKGLTRIFSTPENACGVPLSISKVNLQNVAMKSGKLNPEAGIGIAPGDHGPVFSTLGLSSRGPPPPPYERTASHVSRPKSV